MKVVILGGGPAGYAAASTAAALGADTVLVERETPGGACTLWDAIPTKTILDAADSFHDLEHAARCGIGFGDGLGGSGVPALDLAKLFLRVREVSDHQCAGVQSRLTAAGVRVVQGEGKIVDGETLAVRRGAGETTIPFDRLVVATGASPWLPDYLPGGSVDFGLVQGRPRILTTRNLWQLEALPQSLVVVGAGATGCEMADFFQRCGTGVTLVSSRDRILPAEDSDVAWVVEDSLISRGMKIRHRVRCEGVAIEDGAVVTSLNDGTRVTSTHVLFAVGMKPNSSGIGLEKAGIEVSEKGGIVIDGFSRTSARNIYAAGDVTGGLMLASVASMQGRHAALDALGEKVEEIRYDGVASTVFTRPEVSDVGLTELKAEQKGQTVHVEVQPLLNNPRAVIAGAQDGLVKLVVDPETATVLGGSIVGLRSSELIMTVALAVRCGLTVHELAETGSVNPSVSESLQRVAEHASEKLGGSNSRGVYGAAFK